MDTQTGGQADRQIDPHTHMQREGWIVMERERQVWGIGRVKPQERRITHEDAIMRKMSLISKTNSSTDLVSLWPHRRAHSAVSSESQTAQSGCDSDLMQCQV